MKQKMNRTQRAKQFMPFAALSGLEQELKKAEKIKVAKVVLSEDAEEELDRTLHMLAPRDIVTAVYYFRGEYLKVTGMVAELNKTERYLRIVNLKIPFADLYDLQRIPQSNT